MPLPLPLSSTHEPRRVESKTRREPRATSRRRTDPGPSRCLAPVILTARIVLTLGLPSSSVDAQVTFTDAGFTAETVTTLPPFMAVRVAFAPDGRLLIWQRDGLVRVFENGALLSRPFVDLRSRVNQYGDRGLLGLTLDQDFAFNGHEYLLYTVEPNGTPTSSGPKTARLTRVTVDPANPEVALGVSEVVILDDLPSDGSSHTIGSVRAAPDGTLFVSVGDGADYAGRRCARPACAESRQREREDAPDQPRRHGAREQPVLRRHELGSVEGLGIRAAEPVPVRPARYRVRLAAALGAEQIFSSVVDSNHPSRRAKESAGYREVARFVEVRRLGRRRRWSEPVAGPAGDQGEGARASRARASRAWFESWLATPPEWRSAGFHAMPEEYFVSAAEHIATTLGLDPAADVVLDVGCDSAMITRLVAPRCAHLVGVDFIPGLVADIPASLVRSATGQPGAFVAGDGRSLPFRSHAFTKVYCSGVIHTLPGREDGLAMIDELVRVCRPGGEVLVAAVPDTAKRARAHLDLWLRAGLGGKLRIPLSLATPRRVKDGLRQFLGLPPRLVLLEYDVSALRQALRQRGLEAEILEYPATFWSGHFRRARSNLLIRVGAGRDHGRPAAAAGRAPRDAELAPQAAS
jgi:SAM-dependent methyltransferase